MTHKILLADDSQTIQKVIKITLAQEPYDLIDCPNEGQLLDKIKSENPVLVLLDFHLSENNSGYELCKKIKKTNANIAVLMLYGTYDTVDENALKNCGANSKIIKPFDSTKFVNLCRSLIAESKLTDKEEFLEETISADLSNVESEDINFNEPLNKIIEPTNNKNQSLEDEIAGWGLNLPGKLDAPTILESKIPEVIAKTSIDLKDEILLPKDNDLEYPDLDLIRTSVNIPETTLVEPKKPSLEKPKPQLVSINNFNEDHSLNIELELESQGTTKESDLKRIEDQIRDEIEIDEEINQNKIKNIEETFTQSDSTSDLWAVDEDKQVDLHTKKENVGEDTLFDEGFPIKHESIFGEFKSLQDEKTTIDFSFEDKPTTADESKKSQINDEDVKAAIRELVEEVVKEYCQKHFEKVAWEVMPKVAEKLVKEELKKITQAVLGE